MATQTLDSKKSAWGASGYTSTSDFKVGKTGDGTIYKGRLTFGPLPSGIIITSIKLTMNRIDSYNSHTLKFGVSKSDAWGAQTDDAVNVMVKSGKGSKNLNLSDWPDVGGVYIGKLVYACNSWFGFQQLQRVFRRK